MADRMLFITWGPAVVGREEHGLEVFNEAVGMYGRMQQDGRIEKFEVALLGVNGGRTRGYMSIQGSAEQIATLREDEEYMRNIADASLVVQDISVCEGYCNEGVARMLGIYQDAVGKVPQTA